MRALLKPPEQPSEGSHFFDRLAARFPACRGGFGLSQKIPAKRPAGEQRQQQKDLAQSASVSKNEAYSSHSWSRNVVAFSSLSASSSLFKSSVFAQLLASNRLMGEQAASHDDLMTAWCAGDV